MTRTIDIAPAVRVATGRLDYARLDEAERQIDEAVRASTTYDNYVQATIIRLDGSVELLGISTNLRMNLGADWQTGQMGGLLGNSTGSPATASAATSLTGTGTALTASALIGRRVRTGADVYGNIGANTTSVITVDQWWTVADGVATTPGATAPYTIDPGYTPARFIALTTDGTAIAATDTVLATEITTGGCARALGLYAHTASATTYTLSKTFAVTASFTNIQKAGNFTTLTQASGGLMAFETLLNAAATVANGDSLAVTWTVTNA